MTAASAPPPPPPHTHTLPWHLRLAWASLPAPLCVSHLSSRTHPFPPRRPPHRRIFRGAPKQSDKKPHGPYHTQDGSDAKPQSMWGPGVGRCQWAIQCLAQKTQEDVGVLEGVAGE